MSPRQAFSYDRYRAFLDAVQEGGYRFTSFSDDGGEPGVMLLRHDIDKRVASAREIAEIEREAGARASFFFLLRSPLYSLLEPQTVEDIWAIAAMGHWVGLHCDERRMLQGQRAGTEGFDAAVVRELAIFEAALGFPCSRVVSFHNPSPMVIGRAPETDAFITTYHPRYMMPNTKYLSDSNAHWREGDPLPVLRSGRWPRLQVLTHPIWWASRKPREPLAILAEVVEGRRNEVEAYLQYSNDLWRESRSR
jgi:hypothetical protein